MSPQDIITAMDDYGFTDTTSTRKMEKINDAVWDITTREPWPFMEKTIDLDFDGSSGAPSNFPDDFQADLDIWRLDTGVKLQPMRIQEADASINVNLTTQGSPMYYYFLANTLYVSQVPPASTALMRMRYICKHPQVAQTDPESAFLVPKEHHEIILLGALTRLYDLEDDTDLSVRFEQLYDEKYQAMRGALWMRQYDRPDHIVITDQFDYDSDYWT